MATVYLAEDPVLARLVAIKVLHPHFVAKRQILERFFREARTVARIKNSHVVDIHDIGQTGNSPFMVMEFVDGLTLQKLFDQTKPDALDARIVAALMCQAAEGLTAAAECGIVHRDLKPANMLITEHGRLKIADFGLAHLKGETMTGTGMVLGAQLFMSPEQTMGTKPITPQSDLFSMGSVFYYLLARRPAFYAEDATALRHKIVSEPHRPIQQIRSDLDPGICKLIDTLLQKDPVKRGDGPQWLKRQLQKFLYYQKVIDPQNEVAAYLQTLSLKGDRVTSERNRNELAVILANLEKSPRKVPRTLGINFGVLLSLLLALLLCVAAALYYILRHWNGT